MRLTGRWIVLPYWPQWYQSNHLTLIMTMKLFFNSFNVSFYNCKLIVMLILPKQDNYFPVASQSTPFAHLYVHMSVFVKLYLVLYTAACQSNTFSPVYTQLCISVYICWVMVCIIKCALLSVHYSSQCALVCLWLVNHHVHYWVVVI